MLSSPAYRANRRGVSLMEVLFAIGVTITGLLGVIALIPVAAHYASKGLRADHASTVGTNAISEIELRGMADPNNWLGWSSIPDPRPIGSPKPRPGFAPVGLQAGRSYCLDPRFVAYHQHPDLPLPAPYTGSTWYINSRVFPYGLTETTSTPNDRPWMYRMTLRANPAFASPMTRFQADGIFVSNDELSLDLPDDETLSPVQIMGINGQRRQTDGTLSWFATLVPRMTHDSAYTIVNSSGNSHSTLVYDANTLHDDYILSVVVVYGRDVQYPIEPLLSSTSPGDLGTSPDERILDVTSIFGFDGGGGGEVTLQGASETAVDLQEGDWLLLGRFVPKVTTNPGILVQRTPYFRWYRVATADDEPTQNGLFWARNATLIGPDWNSGTVVVPSRYTSQFPGYADNSQTYDNIAVVVRGVAAVYEKTIRLETASMW